MSLSRSHTRRWAAYLPFLAAAMVAGCASDTDAIDANSIDSVEAELHGPGSRAARGNLAEVAIASPELSTLVAAVVKAGLVDAISDPNTPLTIFAPTNGAFAAAGIDVEATDADTLSAVLLDHVIPGRVGAGRLRAAAFRDASIESLGGLTLSPQRKPLRVNDIPVRFGNRRASNGIIHVIDGVLLDGGNTLVAQAINRRDLSTLVSAVVRAELAETLAGEGPFTVFAPDNAAFAAFGIDPEEVDIDTLTAVLLDHVVADDVSLDDLNRASRRGEPLTTLGGLELDVRRGRFVNGLRITDRGSATNGSFYVINGVLVEQ